MLKEHAGCCSNRRSDALGFIIDGRGTHKPNPAMECDRARKSEQHALPIEARGASEIETLKLGHIELAIQLPDTVDELPAIVVKPCLPGARLERIGERGGEPT